VATRARGEEHFLAMTVHDVGFLLDRLGQDCHPLQFLRELTQNSIEAIGRLARPGEIIWDIDVTTYDLEGYQKLCIIDTGEGMTGDEMVRYINQLSSSVAQQSLSGNYGVGAKISAATRNHAGVVYVSWKDGQGSMIHLIRDPESGQYGLKQFKHADGSYAHFLPVEDDVKPQAIQDHGTMVVLLGNSPDEDTMRAPVGAPSQTRWVSKYLNSRYLRFPEGVTVKAREGWEYPRPDTKRYFLRTLTGQGSYLTDHAMASGCLELAGARVHWWILRDEDAVTNNSGFIESAGHMAALYQNELYEQANGRPGVSRLQQFGITFGYRWVVIYVEPIESASRVLTTNTARTLLLINNEPLPWADWAAEFRENLPRELADFVNEKGAASADTDHTKAIRDRLKDILDLFKFSRYKPAQSGPTLVDDESLVRGGRSGSQARQRTGVSGGTSGSGGTGGNVYAVFEKKEGVPGKLSKPDPFPTVRWVSAIDGTRVSGDLEDRAAKFLPDENLLLANGDFRAFTDMIEFFTKEYGGEPGVAAAAREAVRGWFEQALVEAVIGVQALMNSKLWSTQEINLALSEEALTAVAMQRYHVHFAVRRELGSKLGSRRAQAGS
jgi:hypothetical protein